MANESHTPWSQEEAEKAARDFGTRYEYTGEQVWTREGFRAGIKWAAEFIAKSPTERELVKVIEAWKHAWMDEPDYFDRAFGIDANMKYDLARRLVKMKPIEKGKTDGE